LCTSRAVRPGQRRPGASGRILSFADERGPYDACAIAASPISAVTFTVFAITVFAIAIGFLWGEL